MNITQKQIRRLKTLVGQLPWLAERAIYEGFLTTCIGRPVGSCKDLTLDEAGRVIDELQSASLRPRGARSSRYPGRPADPLMDDEAKGKLLKKIEALLADSKLPWAYADAIARKICRVDKVQWCWPGQLHKIVAALEYNARRHPGKKAAG